MATKVPNPVDKHVGSRARMRRLMLGMSQERLGDQLGITFQQVQKYEEGTNRVSASRLQAMSQILQVPVPFFFEGAPRTASHAGKTTEVPLPAYVSDFLASSDGLKLIMARGWDFGRRPYVAGGPPSRPAATCRAHFQIRRNIVEGTQHQAEQGISRR